MTAILGVSAFYHDSAAALIVDGDIVAAVQEERFTRIKHDDRFPTNAVDYCLQQASLDSSQLDYVGFYEKPLMKFDRLLQTYLMYAPRGAGSFMRAMPVWLTQKLHISRELHRALGGRYSKRFVFPEHHESHAASAFYPSPFEEAAVMTIDGVGEWATATLGTGKGNRIKLHQEMRFPHSLGLLYSAFTYFTGFRVNSGEYKLMGLAPYGEPVYADLIVDKLIDLKDDGSFRMDMSYFNYCQGQTMTSRKFDELFGGPARKPKDPITQREMDLAASVQKVTEDIVVAMARHLHKITGLSNLCLAGGVALNCVANARLLPETPFERLWIQPAAGDAGGALGTALFIWHQLLGRSRTTKNNDSQAASLLGPAFGENEIREALQSVGAAFDLVDDDFELFDLVSALLADGKVVGWFQGRMEFGPRALGARSILGDPRDARMQSVMNQKIKFRESFRPFAPAVLKEDTAAWFDMQGAEESPYMLVVGQVATEHRLGLDEQSVLTRGLEKLKSPRSDIPAVTHVDYSARVQTVDRQRNPRFHSLLESFRNTTGCPVLVNTSFNVRGEPIVCSPLEAYRCFMATDIDALVMENFLLLKHRQAAAGQYSSDEYLSQFALD